MTRDKELSYATVLTIEVYFIRLIRGEHERAPNTRDTASGFICISMFLYI